MEKTGTVLFRDDAWVKEVIYAQRARVAEARRMTDDRDDDDRCSIVISALDQLLADIDEEVEDKVWSENAHNAGGMIVAAQLIFAGSTELGSLLVEVSKELEESGLRLMEQ